MKRVFVAGGASLDTIVYLSHLPDPKPGTIFSKGSQEAPGSTGTAKAIALKRLGFDVTFHALAGDDPAGDILRSSFRAAGVRALLDRDPKGTERHVNLMDETGGRLSIYTSYATFEPELDMETIRPGMVFADAIVLNIINYCRRLIPLAKSLGKETWTDLHDWDGENPYHEDFIEAADVVFLSSEKLPDHRAWMKRQVNAGKRLVVATHGAKGSTVLHRGEDFLEIPAVSAGPVLDVNGAGDNYFSGFLYGLLSGRTTLESARLASAAGALCVSSMEIVPPGLCPELLESKTRELFG